LAGARCTYTPSEWTARCAAGVGTPRLCRALSRERVGSAEAERAALDLNLSAMPSLGELHYTHGTRMAWRVSDVAGGGRVGSASEIATAIFDANRAFAGCIDHAVVADWVSTPVCGASDVVHGTTDARCVELDAECRRGIYDAARSCCSAVDAVAATACTRGVGEHGDDDDDDVDEGGASRTTVGMCDGVGACVEPSSVPVEARASGEGLWIEPVRLATGPWGAPVAWPQPDGSIEILVGDDLVARVPSGTAGHRIRVAQSVASDPGVVAIDVSGDTRISRTLYVPRRVSADTDVASGATYSVCVATMPFDALGSQYADCRGARRVTCPSLPGDPIRCDVDPRGYSAVSAPSISMAWEAVDSELALHAAAAIGPPPDAGADGGLDAGHAAVLDLQSFSRYEVVRVLGAVHLSPPQLAPVRPLSRCRDGARRACPTAACAGAVQVCVGGVWGPCTGRPEICNGIDDDCDGTIDGPLATIASCNDGAACSVDSCTAGTCRSFAGFGDEGRPVVTSVRPPTLTPMCAIGLPALAQCVVPRCMAPSAAPLDSRDTVSTMNLAGCATVSRNSFCTDVWDHCTCNGSELCAPTTAGADAMTGCVSPPRRSPPTFAPGAPAIVHDPCDRDGLACTRDRICCETNADCRLLRTGDPIQLLENQICDDTPIFPVHRFLGTADGQTAECLDFALDGGPASGSDASAPARAFVCPPNGLPCDTPGAGGLCNPLTGACFPEIPLPIGSNPGPERIVDTIHVEILPGIFHDFHPRFGAASCGVVARPPIGSVGSCDARGCDGAGTCVNCGDDNPCSVDCFTSFGSTVTCTHTPVGSMSIPLALGESDVAETTLLTCSGATPGSSGCGVQTCRVNPVGVPFCANVSSGTLHGIDGSCSDTGPSGDQCFHQGCSNEACIILFDNGPCNEWLHVHGDASCDAITAVCGTTGGLGPSGCSLPHGSCFDVGHCFMDGEHPAGNRCVVCDGATGTLQVHPDGNVLGPDGHTCAFQCSSGRELDCVF
jgi:hypothetical protein